MTIRIYDFPAEWYGLIVTQTFALNSVSQNSTRPWGGGRIVRGPHIQFFASNVTMAPTRDPVRQDMDAFFARLRGSSGYMRLSDASRLAPWFNRAQVSPATSLWSDGTGFTDGSGFADGLLPPSVYVATAALRSARYIVLGGFPVSTADVLRRGDLIQVKPNGVPGNVPHLYKVMFNGSSDATGQVGVEIEPGLRTAVAAGDQVDLRNPSTIFRLIDDNQAAIEMSGGGIGNFGFAVSEALELVS